MNNKLKVLVLMGGDSPEREISLGSGETVKVALEKAGFKTESYDPTGDLAKIKQQLNGIDAVLPILHGLNGEDGAVQKVLEETGAPFLGAGSTASANAFNKVMTHKLLEANGIKMPTYEVVTFDNYADSTLLKNPFVLKPIEGGSSLDTIIIRKVDSNSLDKVKSLLSKYDEMLAEELIEGQELTVSVLGDRPLQPIAIIPPPNEEFDYENKYNDKTQELCPIPSELVPLEYQQKAQIITSQVHQILGLRHLSRTDFILSPDGELYVLESNTIPGMRPQSLFPKAAKVAGLSMEKLVNRFVNLTLGG